MAWVISATAIGIAEFVVFERWSYIAAVNLLGASLLVVGLFLMALGLRRLKIASGTQGYWHGVKAILLSAMIISGVSLGQQVHLQKSLYWYMPLPPGASDKGF